MVEVVPRTAAAEVLVCKNVVVAIHREGPAGPAVDGQIAALQKLADANAQGIGFLLILEQGAKTPDTETRRRVDKAFRDIGDRLKACAIVMIGDGFWASAVRSTLAILLVSAARKYETKIFALPPEAITWLAGQIRGLKNAPSSEDLARAVSSLR